MTGLAKRRPPEAVAFWYPMPHDPHGKLGQKSAPRPVGRPPRQGFLPEQTALHIHVTRYVLLKSSLATRLGSNEIRI